MNMNDNTLPVVQKPSFSLAPRDLEEALRFAEILSKSTIIPKDFANNPGNILVAIQWGMELGLQPMQAMQNIAVINGRPSLWGDAVIGLVKSSPLCEYITEEVTDDEAVCKVKRRGEPEQSRTFTVADAKKAGLIGKQGPWTQYPKRMMQMRARSWALRDVFPDVLRGMPIAEEIMDIGEREINPMTAGTSPGASGKTVIDQPPAFYPQDQFDTNLPKWSNLIQSGKKTADDIIKMVQSKAPMTEAQQSDVRAIKIAEQASDAVTFAQVADKLSRADCLDVLDIAADLIGEVSDAAQRAELSGIYQQRAASFKE